jgi:hypothetical protein
VLVGAAILVLLTSALTRPRNQIVRFLVCFKQSAKFDAAASFRLCESHRVTMVFNDAQLNEFFRKPDPAQMAS